MKKKPSLIEIMIYITIIAVMIMGIIEKILSWKAMYNLGGW